MDLRAGLCGSCCHGRVITSERGSTFLLCGAAGPATPTTKNRVELPKYPRLPVLSCLAYTPRAD